MIYVQLDDDNFIEGWGTSEMENSIMIEKDKMEDDVKFRFRSYRYDYETEKFIKDEKKAISDTKTQIIFDFNNLVKEKNNEGFKVTINGELLTFQNTDSNRSFLQKSYLMMESGLINSATMKFINENGNEVLKIVSGATIYEIWILSFMHEDELNKHFNEIIMPQIKNAKTLEELNNITWDEGEEVNSRSMFF